MTVAELIALLSAMPQELPVTVWDDDCDEGAHELDAVAMLVAGDDESYAVKTDHGPDVAYGPHVRIG